MIKVVVFDIDEMIILRERFFSDRFSQEYGVELEKIMPFFKGEFKRCKSGRLDLKEVLEKYLDGWGWPGTVEELLDYWFSGERQIDKRVLKVAKDLQSRGFGCYLATDNEKYRVDYLLNNVGLKRHFTGVFSSPELGFCKSERDFYLKMMEQLGLVANQILFWDSDSKNVRLARAAGLAAEVYDDFNNFKTKLEEYLDIKL